MPFHRRALALDTPTAPVILLDKDDVIHPNIPHFATVMGPIYRKHNYKPHLTPEQIIAEDYYVYGSAVKSLANHLGVSENGHSEFEQNIYRLASDVINQSLAPHLPLNALLSRLAEHGCIFGLLTHNSRHNATRDLETTHLTHLFHPSLILTSNELNGDSKSTQRAYMRMAELLESVAPEREVIMVDDHPHNLAPVASLGWHPVQVGTAPYPNGATWPHFENLYLFATELCSKLPILAHP